MTDAAVGVEGGTGLGSLARFYWESAKEATGDGAKKRLRKLACKLALSRDLDLRRDVVEYSLLFSRKFDADDFERIALGAQVFPHFRSQVLALCEKGRLSVQFCEEVCDYRHSEEDEFAGMVECIFNYCQGSEIDRITFESLLLLLEHCREPDDADVVERVAGILLNTSVKTGGETEGYKAIVEHPLLSDGRKQEAAICLAKTDCFEEAEVALRCYPEECSPFFWQKLRERGLNDRPEHVRPVLTEVIVHCAWETAGGEAWECLKALKPQPENLIPILRCRPNIAAEAWDLLQPFDLSIDDILAIITASGSPEPNQDEREKLSKAFAVAAGRSSNISDFIVFPKERDPVYDEIANQAGVALESQLSVLSDIQVFAVWYTVPALRNAAGKILKSGTEGQPSRDFLGLFKAVQIL